MPDPAPVPPSAQAQPADMPETTALLLLGTFADFYRQELAAEEDVHRTLPFFGTALGIVVAALAYAAGRLPRWQEPTASSAGIATILASAFASLAIVEAGCVLAWLSRAIARRDYQRVGPEPALLARLAELHTSRIGQGSNREVQDQALARGARQMLLESYSAVTPFNRRVNQRRYRFRALASAHLIRSLIWALLATSVIFVSDKLGILPKVMP